MIEIVTFTKANGPLSKRIWLAPDGTVKSNGDACVMARGRATRTPADRAADLAALIEGVQPNQALALGTLREGLADSVDVVTKRKLNGAVNVIARTGDSIQYRPTKLGWVLVDYDRKGMPPEIAAKIRERGGLWATLVSILPELKAVEHVIRLSTSAGLFRADTNEPLPFSGGQHIYLLGRDSADFERFLKALHDRCWLAGFGWYIVSASGQLLERSIVDRMVGAPERLVFEGAPVLDPPLRQNREERRARVVTGDALDTMRSCPPLTIVETSRSREIKAKAAAALDGAAAKARRSYIDRAAQDLVERNPSLPLAAAQHTITQQCEGVLLPDLALPFDDDEFKGCTVEDVLADPDKFEGATLADPREGVDYGRCVAKVMRRADGTPWIHSFAHGRAVYDLKHNAASVAAAVAKAADADVVRVFIELVLNANIEAGELATLRADVSKRSGVGLLDLKTMVKNAREERETQRRREAHARRLTARQDRRPQLPCPPEDAPWLPQMTALNEVIGASSAKRPPGRDAESHMANVGKVTIARTHAFTSETVAATLKTSLPAPEQWAIRRMALEEVAELIERHIDYVDMEGRSVHLPTNFVRHYLKRPGDEALPTYVAVAVLPIVSAEGDVIGREEGIDRKRGIAFCTPPEVSACVPQPGTIRNGDVARAMQFLTDEWLVDVATDYSGKCIIIAAAMTVIERSMLEQRPTFFITAGRRGGGKTTALTMLIRAVMGVSPAASAWSKSEEERRKALLSYFLAGVAYILWDNIARGARVSCPHVERSCTSKNYRDRKLGVSETATAEAAIHLFTGNNIAPTGDLASRSLLAKLELDRADPENRAFTHPDPMGWTDTHRGDILEALFTILLGNPTLKLPSDAPMKTRFKTWWRLVGSAIEHAASLAAQGLPASGTAAPAEAVDFQTLFLARDEDDDEGASLAEALSAMRRMWSAGEDLLEAGLVAGRGSKEFTSAEVLERINADGDADGVIVGEFLFPPDKKAGPTTAKVIGVRLRDYVDNPVLVGRETLTLKARKDRNKFSWFSVKSTIFTSDD